MGVDLYTTKMGHALISLLVGLFRITVAVAPVVAASLTTTDSADFLTLILLYIFSLFRALGYDLIEHAYGLEALLFSYVFVALKTAVYITSVDDSLYVWLPVIISETIFQLIRHIPPGKDGYKTWYQQLPVYLDYWRYTNSELYYAKGNKDPTDTAIPTITWYGTGVMLFLIAIYNGLRVAVIYFGLWNQDGVYASASTEAVYATLIEFVAGIVFVIRLKAMTPKYYTQHSDWWRGQGGLWCLYLFYQICEAVSARDSFAIVIPVMVPIMFASSIWTYGHMLRKGVADASNVSKWYQYVELIQRAIYDLLQFLILEPCLQVYFIMLIFFIGKSSDYEWYQTVVTFPVQIQIASCPILSFVDNVVSQFFDLPINDDLKAVINIILDLFMGIRLQAYMVVQTVYPMIYQACNGAIYWMQPTNDILLLLTLCLPWMTGMILFLQFWPEAERLVLSYFFWITSVGLTLGSLVTTQAFADVSVTVWYLFMQSTYTRNYTQTGVGVLVAQILLVVICMVMTYYRIVDSFNQRVTGKTRLGAQPSIKPSPVAMVVSKLQTKPKPAAKKRYSTTSAVMDHVNTAVQNIEALIFGPGYFLIVSGVTMFIFAIEQGSPVTNVNFRDLPNVLPPWLKPKIWDLIVKDILNMYDMFIHVFGILSNFIENIISKIKIPFEEIKGFVDGIIGAIPTSVPLGDLCDIPGVPCRFEIGWLIAPVKALGDNAIGFVELAIDGLLASITIVWGLLRDEIIAGIESFPGVGFLVDLTNQVLEGLQPLNNMLNYDWFSLDLSMFRYPTFLIYIFIILTVVALIARLVTLFYVKYEWVTKVILSVVLSLFGSILYYVVLIFKAIQLLGYAMVRFIHTHTHIYVYNIYQA